jgi:5-methylcytosine-specific restriction protein A
VNAYERDPRARKACLAHHGTNCSVCGFNFESRYGKIGEGFIHVHHLVPLSEVGEDYEVDPIADLLPVCPNCHAMLHRSDPPLSPAGLRRRIKGR